MKAKLLKNKKVDKKMTYPSAPKRPAGGARACFMEAKRKDGNHELPQGRTIVQALGDMWTAMSEDNRKPYKEAYRAKGDAWRLQVKTTQNQEEQSQDSSSAPSSSSSTSKRKRASTASPSSSARKPKKPHCS